MKRGFTLVEVLVVVGILGILSAISFTAFSSLNKSKAVEAEVMKIIVTLNDARSKTLSSKGPSQYGVHIEESQIVLFRGTSYSSTHPENEVIEFNSNVHVSSTALTGSGSDIIFSRLTGAANKSGTITVSSRSDSGISHVITVFSTGIVQSDL